MKPITSGPDRNTRDERRWPGYLLGGRVRTSTVVLIVVFGLVWWVYDVYRPTPRSVEAPQVVPPGFIPDPNYTWVPRTRLQRPPATVTETVTATPTTTEPTPPTPTGEFESPPPLFPFPLPPPFSPPESPPHPPPVSPGVPAPSAVPTSPPAAPATRSPP